MHLAVLFDLDDTLIDHTAAARAAASAWVAEVAPDCQAAPEQLAQAWLRIEREHYDAFLRGACSFAEQRRRRLRAFLPALGLPVHEHDLDRQFAGYVRHYEAAGQVYPDVVDTVLALRRRPAGLGVLTNGDERRQRAKLERVGLGTAFDAVATSGGLGRAKPHPDAFTTACALLGHRPGDVWYVGDNLATDCLAAGAAGLNGIWLNRRAAAGPASVRQVDRLTRVPGLLPPVPGYPDASTGTAWTGQLHRLADAMASAHWMVTGGAALRMYGADVPPGGIDIVTDTEGLTLLRHVFADWIADGPVPGPEVAAALRLCLGTVPVDVHDVHPTDSRSGPAPLDGAVPVHWAGRIVPAAPLSGLYRDARGRGSGEQVDAIRVLLDRYGLGDPQVLLPAGVPAG